MNLYPSLEEVRQIAQSGKYDVLPVCCEILSDFITPIEAVRILKKRSSHCYMLESAQANETWGRYTFLGYDPKLSIVLQNGELTVTSEKGTETSHTEDPAAYLRELLSRYRSPRFASMPPFTGGLVGYFSYDYLGYAEPAVRSVAEDTEDFKDVDLMLFDRVIAFDNIRQKILLIANMPLDDPEEGYREAELELQEMAGILRKGEKAPEPAGRLLGRVTPLFEKERFCEMVERAK
ncbi:MAG: anthranilate synthase component I, partial [Lachnospiraceae bacterium]|nr:anthranilate synthase component I [Lachnospiraceae bacterium]